ncbi:MAG: hypothetical protein SAK29_33265 [Scytonema sp. PMC 1069.18]|nr:hypothetical protein [Scytonema sp. PMC 1069.18]MEC4885363.1 hypothetical protein [Scytonema sp. PMC 1070.18]
MRTHDSKTSTSHSSAPQKPFALKNKENVKTILNDNFERGEVPLFHIGAYTGTFYINKETIMGQLRPERSPINVTISKWMRC